MEKIHSENRVNLRSNIYPIPTVETIEREEIDSDRLNRKRRTYGIQHLRVMRIPQCAFEAFSSLTFVYAAQILFSQSKRFHVNISNSKAKCFKIVRLVLKYDRIYIKLTRSPKNLCFSSIHEQYFNESKNN